MQVTETLSEGLKREFKVVVPAADLESKVSGKLKDLAGRVRLPGFRPGKAPVALLRKTYGRAVLGEVLEETVGAATQQTLDERKVRPAMQPKIEVKNFDEGGDLEYVIAVEVMPDFEPTDFRQIKLEKLSAEVSDEEVQKRLDAMAEQMKSYAEVAEGQAAKSGDAVVIDFKGSIDGEVFEGGSGTDFELVLGSGSFIPGFEGQLEGVQKGDKRTVDVTFPEDYGHKPVAGKQASFEVEVKQVKAPLPTAVDDELAKKLGLENLEALRQTMRRQLERDYAGLSRARLKRALLDALAEKHDFPVPPGLVETEFDNIWGQVEQERERLKQAGQPAEPEKPEEEEKADYRAIAERRVRLGLLLAEVGQRNNVTVTQDEVNRAMAEQARRFPGQERQVFEYFQKNPQAQASLRAPILEEKVCDFIIEMAEVSDRKTSVEELLRDPDEDEAKPAG
jgi:trigger factor